MALPLVREIEEEQETRVRYEAKPWHHRVNAFLDEPGVEVVVVNAGVWCAKTTYGTLLALELIAQKDPSGSNEPIWWIAGLSFQMEAFWRKFVPIAEELGIHCTTHPWRTAVHPNGSTLHCVTAKELGNLSAHHPWFIIGDEVAKWSQEAWDLVRVRMANAQSVLMSSPKPVKHWRQLISWGKEKRDGRYRGITVTTPEVGILTPAQCEAARRDMSADMYGQEFLALLISGAGTVFKGINEIAVGKVLAPRDGERYVVGYDPAKSTDYGYALVRKLSTNQIVKALKFQGDEYHHQAGVIVALCERYNKASLVFDYTGPGGQAVGEILDRQTFTDGTFPHLVPITFDNLLKGRMVEKLKVRMEGVQLSIPSDEFGEAYEELITELEQYEMQRSPKGLTYTYGAPTGAHDDGVTALGLTFLVDEESDYVREVELAAD